MKPRFLAFVGSIVAILVVCMMADPKLLAQQATATRPATTAAPAPAAPASLDAQREAVWNSPEMLRARAWFADYLKNDKSITPDEAKQMQAELERLTPAQMKLFMVRHEYEYQQQQKQLAAMRQNHIPAGLDSPAAIRAQQMWFQTMHKASLNQAYGQEKSERREFSDINRDESEAAGEEQKQLNTQAAAEREAGQEKEGELNAPGVIDSEWGGYGYGYPGVGYGYPVFYGGNHYHMHAGTR